MPTQKQYKCFVVLSVSAIIISLLYLVLSTTQAYFVSTTCTQRDFPAVYPAHCKGMTNSLYWSAANYTFENFGPCASADKLTQCRPISSKVAIFSESCEGKKICKGLRITSEENKLSYFIMKRVQFVAFPLFLNSNLVSDPFTSRSDLQITTENQNWHYVLDEQLPSNSLAEVSFNLSIQRLCEQNQSVFIHHFADLQIEETPYSCAKYISHTMEQLLAVSPVKDIKFIKSRNNVIHRNQLAKFIVLYTYGGFIIDPESVLINAFKAEKFAFSVFNDSASVITPIVSLAHAPKHSEEVLRILQNFHRFYNPDCKFCTEIDLVKFTYSTERGIALFDNSVYLPQAKFIEIYRIGGFDNDVYERLIDVENLVWNLRFSKGVYEDFCDQSNLLYSVSIEKIFGVSICK